MKASEFIRLLNRQINDSTATGPIEVLGQPVTGGREPVTGAVDLHGRVFPRPVVIRGFVFDDLANLADACFKGFAEIEDCRFHKGLCLRDMVVAGRGSLKDCAFDCPPELCLDWRRLRVQGVLDLTCVTACAGIDLSNLVCEDDLFLNGLHCGSAIKDKDTLEAADIADAGLRHHLASEMSEKALNLEGADIRRHIYADRQHERSVVVTGMIDLRAKIGGQVAFNQATIQVQTNTIAIDMDSAEVGDSVFFRNNTQVTGQIDLIQAKIGGQVAFNQATIQAQTDAIAVNMDSAEVGGSVFFRNNTQVTGQIDLIQAKIGGQVAFNQATIQTQTDTTAIDMQSAKVGGSVFFQDKTQVTGQIDLRAKIGGQVAFNQATIQTQIDTTAIDMDSAEVGGLVLLGSGTTVVGSLSMVQAILRSGVYVVTVEEGGLSHPDIERRTFTQPQEGAPLAFSMAGQCWDMSYAKVTGPVMLHGMSLAGEFIGKHLEVDGDLDICGSVVGAGTAPKELTAPAPLTPRTIFTAEEAERKPSPRSRKDGECEFFPAIDLEMAKIKGRLWVKSSRVLGTIHMPDLELDGNLDLSNTTVEQGDLSLRSAVIRGKIFQEDTKKSTPCPKVSGKVDLSFAQVQQAELVFDSPDVTTPAENLTPPWVDMTGAKVETLTVRSVAGEKKDQCKHHVPWFVTEGLTFENLDVASLCGNRVPGMSWRDGLRVVIWGALCAGVYWTAWRHGSTKLTTVLGLVALTMAVLFWLEERKKRRTRHRGAWGGLFALLERTYPFSAGFYRRVEQWLREAGNDPLADEVFHSRRRRESSKPRTRPRALPVLLIEADGRGGRAKRVWTWFVDFALGFGVRPGRLVHLFVLLWLLNTAVFLNPRSVERPLSYLQSRCDALFTSADQPANTRPSTESEAVGENVWVADGGRPGPGDHWGSGHAFFMAMRMQIPLISLAAESDWEPSSRAMWRDDWPWVSYQNYASFMMAVNLLLVPTILAGAAGLLKRDQ